MTKNCPECGCPLQSTTHDRGWCPNCFKAIENEEPSEEDSYLGYFG
ncbi:hypothetical protein LCGC14_0462270 [marine sediment metagenome]|uniref:Viral late gene transcription factor 3 zinc ribbon domain-containing protein n=1 Tax=marine sediment metagenome TaxID=412755 RepID=A0A0F9VNM3_9ZZZZ